MKLNEVLNSEELSNEEKIAKVAETVAKAKEAYGNTGTDITVPDIMSTEGFTALSMISLEGKVELAKAEIARIKMDAYEDSQNEGVVLNRRIEEYLAISPVLSNITSSIENDYL